MKTEMIKIAIVASLFRKEVSDNLLKNCLETLKKGGITEASITVVRVPGSWEIPLVVKKLAIQKKYDAIITFGCILKGKTYHFEQLANDCARACMDIALEFETPVVYEVLAVYDIKDALERATRKVENKGVEAAETTLAMIDVLKQI